MTSHRWPSRSEKLREYMKPSSCGGLVCAPPAASARSARSSTPVRDSALIALIASVAPCASTIALGVNRRKNSWVRSIT
ncbi:hypothetical protein D3C74_457780 [compost metagenome]